MDKVYKIGFFILVGGLLLGTGLLIGTGYPGGDKASELVEKVIVDTDEEEEVVESEVATEEAVIVEEEDLGAIFGAAFEEKYNKTAGSAEVTITTVEGDYVSGGVKFAGEIAGGWFLGAKDEGSWVIVADGNGTVLCDDIEPYDFSTEMVPGCWDEAIMDLRER